MVLGFVTAIAINVVGNQIYDMATPSPYAKDYGNLAYHAAVVGGLTLGYNIILKKVLKMKPADLGNLDFEDSATIIGTVALAMWTKDMLVKHGLPDDIVKR